MKLFWRILALAAGITFFAWYLSRVGWDQIWGTLQRLGPFAPLVLLPYLVVYGVDCLAWTQTLPRKNIPFFTLLRIRWAGESVNNVLPSVYIGGEAVKVCLLRAHGISAAEGTTSAIVSKTAQTLAQLAFILAAGAVLSTLVDGQTGLHGGIWIVVLGGLAAVAALFWAQSQGLFRLIFAALRSLRCRIAWLDRRETKLRHLDETIVDFYRRQPGRFGASTALYLGGWLLDSVEIYLVAYLLGMPIHWTQALVVEAFTGIAKALGMWIPGSVGVQESGIILMGRMAGLPDALGATYALIRRFREVIFAVAGLLFLYGDESLRAAEPNAATQLIK